MPEQITLQQISEMMRQEFATQTAHVAEMVDQKLAVQTAHVAEMVDQKLAVQTAHVAEMMRQEFSTQTAHVAEMVDQKLDTLETRMDQKLDTLETRMDQKLDAQETRMDQRFAEMKAYVDDAAHQAIESAVAIVQSNFEKYADRIINRGHALVENVEGRQIRLLNEQTQLHEETLDNHEHRIHKLEEAAV